MCHCKYVVLIGNLPMFVGKWDKEFEGGTNSVLELETYSMVTPFSNATAICICDTIEQLYNKST